MSQHHSEQRDGMRVDWDAPVEMSDGLVLRVDVFRPDDDARYPVILAYGPYAKGLAFDEGFPEQFRRMVDQHPDVLEGSSGRYHNFEVVDPEKWVPDGYVCVRVDSRGAGRSPGYLCLFQERETQDLYECIEWAARQPWSDGKVGLSGISYLAMNQWHVARLDPPSLVAMIPWEGAADFYRDASHHGGIRSVFWDNLVERVIAKTQHGVGDRGYVSPNTGELVAGPDTLSQEELEANRCDFAEELRAHPFDDAFYAVRSPDWSKVRTPFLSSANWGGQGLHLRGNVEAFTQAAASEKWLEVHGLEHWTHYYTDYGVGLQKQFFAYYLKGEDNGWGDRPPVLLQVRHLDHFEERAEHEWPLARTRWTRLHLDPGAGGLAWEPPAEASHADYDATDAGLTLLSPPLAEETEVTGPGAARLPIASSTTDADLFLVLRVFDPDGGEVVFQGHTDPHTPIGQGWLRASHRALDPERSTPYRPYHPHDAAEPLEPDRVYPVDVELWPTSIVIPAGYRIGLSVRGTDYEFEGTSERAGQAQYAIFKDALKGSGPFLHNDPRDRPPEIYGGTVTVHGGGDHDAFLLLPIVPRA